MKKAQFKNRRRKFKDPIYDFIFYKKTGNLPDYQYDQLIRIQHPAIGNLFKAWARIHEET